MKSNTLLRLGIVLTATAVSLPHLNQSLEAQPPAPTMVDPELSVRSAVSGLTTPVGMAFLPRGFRTVDRNRLEGAAVSDESPPAADLALDEFGRRGPVEMFVIEKMTGQVKLVVDGAVTATVLDLAVNFASERGLLGIALHPRFPRRPFVYLYWTCRTADAPPDTFRPEAERCDESAMTGARYGRDPAGAAAREPRRSIHLER